MKEDKDTVLRESFTGTAPRLPQHVAIILDGNGRWAKKRRMPRTYGHMQGSKNVETICRAADAMGIRYLTFYAFSTENWKRPPAEVAELMRLLHSYMNDSLKLSRKNNMRVRVIGDKTGLEPELQEKIERLERASAGYTGLQLTIALNYGGRDEIARAVRELLQQKITEGVEPGRLAEQVTEEGIASCLDTAGLPDPDLLIRTSGEQRLSNYLLWQLAYAELYFTDVLWPDFSEKDLRDAVEYYGSRERRFGGI